MSNFCYNFVSFICPNKEIYDFFILALKDDAWFETFAPLDFDSDSEDFCDNWSHKKALAHWGTKYPPSDVEILNQCAEKFSINVGFNSAVTAPQRIYKKMFEDFDIKVTAFYYEPGYEFFGWSKYNNDEQFDERFLIPFCEEELEKIKKKIPIELNNFMESIWKILHQ